MDTTDVSMRRTRAGPPDGCELSVQSGVSAVPRARSGGGSSWSKDPGRSRPRPPRNRQGIWVAIWSSGNEPPAQLGFSPLRQIRFRRVTLRDALVDPRVDFGRDPSDGARRELDGGRKRPGGDARINGRAALARSFGDPAQALDFKGCVVGHGEPFGGRNSIHRVCRHD
jgi:hypothetical protein